MSVQILVFSRQTKLDKRLLLRMLMCAEVHQGIKRPEM